MGYYTKVTKNATSLLIFIDNSTFPPSLKHSFLDKLRKRHPCAALLTLLPSFSVSAAIPSTPTLDGINSTIYANGHPIIIEAGVQDPNKTRIRYDNDKYLNFTDGSTTTTEVDLSQYEIYGGTSEYPSSALYSIP